MRDARAYIGAVCVVLFASTGAALRTGKGTAGPFDLRLFPTPSAPHASGDVPVGVRTVPFGIAVLPDGRASTTFRITAAGLPAPSTLGPYTVYVAWAVTPDLRQWVRLGTLTNGTTTVGPVALNKFLFVVSAESSGTSAAKPVLPCCTARRRAGTCSPSCHTRSSATCPMTPWQFAAAGVSSCSLPAGRCGRGYRARRPRRRGRWRHAHGSARADVDAGHGGSSMAMPIPMPAGMMVIPGFVGLRPPGPAFLPEPASTRLRFPRRRRAPWCGFAMATPSFSPPCSCGARSAATRSSCTGSTARYRVRSSACPRTQPSPCVSQSDRSAKRCALARRTIGQSQRRCARAHPGRGAPGWKLHVSRAFS